MSGADPPGGDNRPEDPGGDNRPDRPGIEKPDVPDAVPEHAAHVREYTRTHKPPFGADISRGERAEAVEFMEARDGFKNGRVELVFADGRHVTVHPERDLHGLWER